MTILRNNLGKPVRECQIVCGKCMAPWKNRTSRYIFSAHHSVAFYFCCFVYWWEGSVRF